MKVVLAVASLAILLSCGPGVRVSERCDSAMASLSDDWIDDMAPLGAMQMTLVDCGSKAEWMAAADRHRGDPTPATGTPGRAPVVAGSSKPTEQLWREFCELRGNVDGPTPACDG